MVETNGKADSTADGRQVGRPDRRAGAPAQRGPMVDATAFLAFTDRLRQTRTLLEQAKVDDGRRSSWQQRLIAVTEAAQMDMSDAIEKLERLEADVSRHG